MSRPRTSTVAEDLTEQLRAEGYQPGPPAHLDRAAHKIDREVCAESKCEACGWTSLVYKAWHKGRSYRALAVCPRCCHTIEF